jgi:hypothetical protein
VPASKLAQVALTRTKAPKTSPKKAAEAPITLALQAIASLQVRRGITPVILDYNQSSNRLSIVDRSFKVWLANQDCSELCWELELPVPDF